MTGEEKIFSGDESCGKSIFSGVNLDPIQSRQRRNKPKTNYPEKRAKSKAVTSKLIECGYGLDD